MELYSKRENSCSMEREEILGDNRIEDVRWLCSLSESELDLLISLKNMVVKRALAIGHESLARNFDLKMLRALSFVLMKFLKGQLKDSSGIPSLAESSACIDKSNLSKHSVSDDFGNMGVEELMSYLGTDEKKRIAELFGKDLSPGKKKRTDSRTSMYT